MILSIGFLAGGAGLILLLPLFLGGRPILGLLLVPFVVATPTLWALIHEAIHGSLHPLRPWNDALGRALAISFGAPLRALRFGHLTHHRLYGVPEERLKRRRRPMPRLLAVPFHYARIFGGVYLVEVATVFIAFLPRALLGWIARQALGRHPAGGLDNHERIERDLLSREGLARLRIDSALILTLYGTGFVLFGPHGWMLLAALVGRAAIVSFMDNIYHYRPPGTPRRTMNLELPPWASAAILHANLHAVHHRQPGMPWSRLPEVQTQYPDMPQRGFLDMSLDQLLKPAA